MLCNREQMKLQTKYMKSLKASPAPWILLLVIIGAYFAGVQYFNSHFCFHTTINGTKCQLMTAEEVEEKYTRQCEDYLLTVVDLDGKKYFIKGVDFDYAYASAGNEAGIILAQDKWLWPLSILENYTYEFGVTAVYDEAKLQTLINRMSLFDRTAARTYNKVKVQERILAAIADKEEILNLDEDCLKKTK